MIHKIMAWMRIGFDSTYSRFIIYHIFKYIITFDIIFDTDKLYYSFHIFIFYNGHISYLYFKEPIW